MPKLRKALGSLDATHYYHSVSRCVRRAIICGEDPVSGFSYEFRRDCGQKTAFQLAKAFSIDICAYAIMSIHYPIVLHINQGKNKLWSDEEVVIRWHQLFLGSCLSR